MGLLIVLHLLRAIVEDRGVDIEAVDGVDAQRSNLRSVFGTAAGRCSEYGYVNVFQFLNVVDNGISCQFCRLVLISLATDDACNFKVTRGFQRLNGVAADISIAHYGCSDFLHFAYIYR